MDVARSIRCIQVDPINVVARTQLLTLFSRVGSFDPSHLDRLLWTERSLFHYWAHAASLVLTEDYPIHRTFMRTWPNGNGAWTERVRAWMAANETLRRHILRSLRRNGPMRSRDLGEPAAARWSSTGWTDGRDVNRMLEFLWTQGKVVVAGRRGVERLWDLMENVLPEWTPRESLSQTRAVKRSVDLALRALGAATPGHIREHFTRGRYPGLEQVLGAMERRKEIARVDVVDGGAKVNGRWYARVEDIPLLTSQNTYSSRTVLLSPFDNLICDRRRTNQLFGFDFRIEIYVPVSKRRYGYYVMPILHGDRLIGRIDPRLDRKEKVLEVKAVHAEDGAPDDVATGSAVAAAIEDLAAFVGARAIRYPKEAPPGWRASLV